jgi:hypothetical protein
MSERRFKAFVKRLLTNLDNDKPFSITFNNETYYVSRNELEKIKEKTKGRQGSGFLDFFDEIIKTVKGFFTGEGVHSGNGFLGEGLEASGGFLGFLAKGARFLFPKIIKLIKKILPHAGNVAQVAEGVTGTIKNVKETAEGKGMYLDTFSKKNGGNITDFLLPVIASIQNVEDEGRNAISSILSKLTPFFKISKTGDGLFLRPK